MSDEAAKMRMERIERLIRELEYEVTRGIMEREIEPDIHFSKTFPCPGRGDGVARMDLHVYIPHEADAFTGQQRAQVKLRLVK